MTKVLLDGRGEGYVDVAVSVFAILLVLALGVNAFPMFMTKMQLDNFADELIREAEVSGRVGAETSARYERLAEKTHLRPTVTWSQTGRIQLNQEVSVTVTLQTDFGFIPGLGAWPVTLTARAAGKSEVYWK
ncbi:MAG: DUF4320 family protein [Lachnospiraceae bacterium]|nr:DUF4320 family protein [Lachnospiraceae bacterium]